MQVNHDLKPALFGVSLPNRPFGQQGNNVQSVQEAKDRTVDRVEISAQGYTLAAAAVEGKQAGQSSGTREDESQDSDSNLNPQQELTKKEQQEVNNLKNRDREVRTHEQAHKAAAGNHASGGPSYEYQTGPDGKRYAVGGEVQIDTSPVRGDPQATIRKAQVIQQAAMAPAEPSSQDRQVAAEASRMEAEAHKELTQQRIEKIDVEFGGQKTATESTEESNGASASNGKFTSDTAALFSQVEQSVQQKTGPILDLFA